MRRLETGSVQEHVVVGDTWAYTGDDIEVFTVQFIHALLILPPDTVQASLGARRPVRPIVKKQ